MVYQTEPHDLENESMMRLRNSAIGPWIDFSTGAAQESETEPLSTSSQFDITLRDLEQEQVMSQVGNLLLPDQDDDNAHTNLNSTISGNYGDAIIEQSPQIGDISDISNESLELTLEPQNVSVIYLDGHESAASSQDFNDVITIRDYNRVLELSHPFEFSIPTVQQESNISHIENFIQEFETSLSRIEDIQREINEIRELYNNLLTEDEFQVQEISDIPNEHGEDVFDQDTEESILSRLEGGRSRTDDIDSLSQFFNQLSREEEEAFEFPEEEDEEDENIEEDSIISTSWRFENGALVRRQFPQQEGTMHRNLLPNFYLDSNGIPRIEFERQLNLRTRNILTNDYSSKTAPFCRMDSNGDLECVIAFYPSNSQGELNVDVYDKSQHKAETLLFKEIQNSWRNDHGECIGR